MRASRGDDEARAEVQSSLAGIQPALRQIPDAPDRDSLRGLEGAAAVHYFAALRRLLGPQVHDSLRSDSRSRRPPQDRFNALLSYGYGLLHTAVLRAVLASGLEPALGFFHTPRSAAYPLVLDLMELFRVPHAWVSGDGELGRSSWLRGQLQARGEAYLLAVPPNTSVRDLAAEVPYAGRGRHPKAPFTRVDRWAAALPAAAWQAVEVRDAEKGPLVVQVARGLVQALAERRPSDVAELAVAVRERQPDGTWKCDYLLSNAPLDTPPAEFARVFKARHRVEECLKRAKGEAGLADYQVRTWAGWHHHQALSLIATWFLTRETRRGKKVDPGADGAAGPPGDRPAAPPAVGVRSPGPHPPDDEPGEPDADGGAGRAGRELGRAGGPVSEFVPSGPVARGSGSVPGVPVRQRFEGYPIGEIALPRGTDFGYLIRSEPP